MTEEITKDIRVAFTDYMDKIDALAKQNNELKQERDELKKENIILLGQLVTNDRTDISVQIPDYVEMNKQIDELKQENEELKSALEEIREIAKDIIENDVYENSDVKVEKILELINEVLNESN